MPIRRTKRLRRALKKAKPRLFKKAVKKLKRGKRRVKRAFA